MKDPFEYQAPTPVTAPKYAAIREAAASCEDIIDHAVHFGNDAQVKHERINEACRGLYELIRSQVPDCGDRDAAFRCVRLARMAANEAVVMSDDKDDVDECYTEARRNLRAARWQACAAVALHDWEAK